MENVKKKQPAGLLPVRSGDKAVPSQLPSRESFIPRDCPLPATVACAVCLPTNLVRLPRTPVARFCHAVRDGQSLVRPFWNPVPARCNAIPAFCDLIRAFWSAIPRFWNEIRAFCDDVRVFWNAIQTQMNPVFNHLHDNRRFSAVLSGMRRVRCGLRVRVGVPNPLRAGDKVCLTFALIPAFSPGEKENCSPSYSKTCEWIGRVAIKPSADGQKLFPLLGERVRVREVVTHFWSAVFDCLAPLKTAKNPIAAKERKTWPRASDLPPLNFQTSTCNL